MSQSSLTHLIGEAGKSCQMQGLPSSVSPSNVSFSPQKAHKQKFSVGPEPTSLQLKKRICRSVERNVIEEINLHQTCRDGMYDAVQVLLSDGSRDVNKIDSCGFSPLHYAAKYNHADIASLLLDHGADPSQFNLYDTRKLTPLQIACWFNSLEVVRVLLTSGPKGPEEEGFEQRAIHCAAARGSLKIVEELLLVGKVDPNAIDKIGFTPLHIAASRGREKIVKVLVDHGADVTIQDHDGNMPTHIAAREGHAATLKALLQSVSGKAISMEHVLRSNGTGSCLQLATRRSNVEAAKVCIEFKASTSANLDDTTPPLHTACILGNMELLKSIVSSGASLEAEDIEGMTPILRACLNGNVEIIEYLINEGASLEAEVDAPSPLMCAVKRGHSDAIRLLLRRGSSVFVRDLHQRTCLHVAVWSDNEGTLDILLEDCLALINSRDKECNTPLHYAALNGNLKMILKLLDSGADNNLGDDEDKLPIHLAAEVGDLECFKALFDINPESIHATDYRLRTPLYYAALENHTEVVSFLIENGAHVNIRDDDRLSPLLAVCRESSVDIVELLLNHGANLESLSKNRATALLVASFYGNSHVVRTLLNRGAKIEVDESPFGKGCLEAAMRGGQKDTCMEIIKHKRWRDALKVKDHEGFTCMKGLIEKYPDVAKVVLDKCVVSSNYPPTDEKHSITYNFEFLSIHPDERIYTGCDTYFGPLTMLQNGRSELLLHPVTRELLRAKWNAIAKYQVLFALSMYITFAINFTLYIICFGQINPNTGKMISYDYPFCRDEVMNYQSLAVSLFSGIWLLTHMYRALRERWNYMNRDSLVEVVMLLSCLMSSAFGEYVLVLDQKEQFTWGIYSIVVCYIVLLFYIQTVFDSGIYVTMLFVVLKSLVKVFAIFLILIVAFALVFTFLLYKGEELGNIQGPNNTTIVIKHPFNNIWSAAVKVMAMMIGELEYTRFFVEQDNDSPPLTIFIFVVFCLLLPIVLMNLLIGLAVGDIESVQKNAELKLLTIKIEVIYATEQQLPAFILRYFYKPSVVQYPNRSRGWCSKCIEAVGHRLSGSSSDKDDMAEDTEQTERDSLEKLVTKLCGQIKEQDKRMDKLVSDVEQQRTILDQIADIVFRESDSRL
ncbi:transient receptor potential cation channel subfamily A member 1-like [Actinia tenebrosa]|uniref:Transient receptor potential cation channel subfamily A member 1-like n=1 Tax=Actinia tenebrosa TaxID=6105 RepID=A0A6P8IBE2_ACTTE|nr:transient receptor potential cation channel subfamily A member 1-like [Actinia tenebrosa]